MMPTLAPPMLLFPLLLLGAALAGPATGNGDVAAGGPLLACGTAGDDTANMKQVSDLFGFGKGVCVDQLGEQAGSGLLPSTCKSVGCQRVAALLSDSCAAFFQEGFVGSVFKPMLDPLAKTCQAAALSQPPQRFAITDPTGGSIQAGTSVGAAITDGMGAGGHNSSVSGQGPTRWRCRRRPARSRR